MFCACVLMLTSCSVSPQDGLKAIADLTNSLCPTEQAEGVTLTKVSFENNQLVYDVQVNDEVLAVMDGDAAKASIVNGLKNEQNKDLTDLIKAAQASIVYNYVGIESGDTMEITISYTEL